MDFFEAVQSNGVAVFTPRDFESFMGVRRKAAQALLGRYVQAGAVLKLRNGYYAPKSKKPSEYLISNRVYQPSYVSFETALSHHGLIPETVYAVSAATTKATREFTILGVPYLYHKIKRPAYTGYSPTKVGSDTVFIASAEKALVDYLYFVHLGRKTMNDRIKPGRVDEKKVREYSRLFGNQKFARYVEDAV
ncbi:MAG: hypothetical protein V1875_09535 [Candidatus Altiarchaeota archaeon]